MKTKICGGGVGGACYRTYTPHLSSHIVGGAKTHNKSLSLLSKSYSEVTPWRQLAVLLRLRFDHLIADRQQKAWRAK